MIRIATFACALMLTTTGNAAAQTTVQLPSHLTPLSVSQREAGERWMAARGFRYDIKYMPDGTIAFAYGGAEHRLSEQAFLDAVKRVLNDSTVAILRRAALDDDSGAVLSEISHFSSSGELHAWTAGETSVRTLIWRLRLPTDAEKDRGVVGALICMNWPGGAREVCSPAYEQLIGFHGRQAGDPFGLETGLIPPVRSTDDRWPNGDPLFPDLVPHDLVLAGLNQ